MILPWRITLLGGLRAQQGDRVVTRFRTQKTAALLAYLAYHLPGTHPRELLADLLWPEADLTAGRNSLTTALWALRRQLEPPGTPCGSVLVASRLVVGLNPEAVTTDAGSFQAALDNARRTSGPDRIRWLAEAVELYSGRLLPDFYEDWVSIEQERLTFLLLEALRELIRSLEAVGETERALHYARRAVEVDPLVEEAHCELMRLYARVGRSEAALRQYGVLERMLREELGGVPSRSVRELAQGIEASQAGSEAFVTSPPAGALQPGQEGMGNGKSSTGLKQAGTVTFLLAEWASENAGDEIGRPGGGPEAVYHAALARHGGMEWSAARDDRIAVFQTATEALACAVEMLADRPPTPGPAPRLALHTGEIGRGEGGDRAVLDTARRLLRAAPPGHALASETTAILLRRSGGPPTAGLRLTDRGLYRLPGGDAAERVFLVERQASGPAASPELRGEAIPAATLPVALTRFFGREEELALLAELLPWDETRLVTVTGPAGCGKTRLALEAARRLLPTFPGTVWLVRLADTRDARLLPGLISQAMGIAGHPEGDTLETIADRLCGTPGLLVLDNFEHLPAEATGTLGELLERCATLTCLVTSRRRVDLPGERELVLTPLPVPDWPAAPMAGSLLTPADTPGNAGLLASLAACPSVRLFLDRAQSVRPDFQITPRNAGDVARICARLEGLPLALELAASRVRALALPQMLLQLEQSLAFLAARSPQIAARHQSLLAAFDWSCHLLSPDLQRFFAFLSVFRGGWTLEAAEAVCGRMGVGVYGSVTDGERETEDRRGFRSPVSRPHSPVPGPRSPVFPTPPHPHTHTSIPPVLEALEQLQDASLVQVEEEGVAARFRMLELVRQYAVERLDPEERARIARGHAEYFLERASAYLGGLRTAREEEALRELEAEADNLRAALDWARNAAEPRLAAELALVLARFLQRRGHLGEAAQRIGTGLEAFRLLGDPEPALRARLLREQANLCLDQFRWEDARQYAEESLELCVAVEDGSGQADAQNLLGLAARGRKDFPQARYHLQAALAQFRAVGDPLDATVVLANLGLVESEDASGDLRQAREYLTEALERYRASGYRRGIAEAETNLGLLAHRHERYDEAWCHYAAALQIEREIRYPFGVARALCNLGESAEAQGRPDRAARLYHASAHLFARAGSPFRHYAAGLLSRLGRAAGLTDDLRRLSPDSVAAWALEEIP